MLNARLSELVQSANPPFTRASSYYSDFFVAKTKEAFALSASSKADGIETALKTLLQETERARRFGFTESGYTRTRQLFAEFRVCLQRTRKDQARFLRKRICTELLEWRAYPGD